MRKRTSFRDSTFKTLEILRASDRVMDSINDMGSPPTVFEKFIRQAKRELVYVAAVVWQIPAILTLYAVCFWIVWVIIF